MTEIKFASKCQGCGEYFADREEHKCNKFTAIHRVVDAQNPDATPESRSIEYSANSHEDAALQWAMEHIGYIFDEFLKRRKPRGVHNLIPVKIAIKGEDGICFSVVISGMLAFNSIVDITLCVQKGEICTP